LEDAIMLSRQFLTVKDVAELLKIGEGTVRHRIRAGDLRAIDLGREWRIAPENLEGFIQRHETVGRRWARNDTARVPRVEREPSNGRTGDSPDVAARKC